MSTYSSFLVFSYAGTPEYLFYANVISTGDIIAYRTGSFIVDKTNQSTTLTTHSDMHYFNYVSLNGARGSVVVKALRYKPEGRGFDTR
jgi:hypothetical protein